MRLLLRGSRIRGDAHEAIDDVHGNCDSIAIELTLVNDAVAPIDDSHAVCGCNIFVTELAIGDGGGGADAVGIAVVAAEALIEIVIAGICGTF